MSFTRRDTVFSRCDSLREMHNFKVCKIVVEGNKSMGKDWPELDKAKAICDVMIAAENHLLNGFMDYYGMIGITWLGPLVLDEFKKLMEGGRTISYLARRLISMLWMLKQHLPTLNESGGMIIYPHYRECSTVTPDSQVEENNGKGRGRGRGRGRGHGQGRGRSGGRGQGRRDKNEVENGGIAGNEVCFGGYLCWHDFVGGGNEVKDEI